MTRLFSWARTYLVYLVIGICLAGGWYGMRAKQIMHTRARYTISYTHGTHRTLKSGRQLDYRFKVGD